MNAPATSLTWALESEQGHSALFGVRISSFRDLERLLPLLHNRGIHSTVLDAKDSHDLVLAIIEGRAKLPEAGVVFLTDALAPLSVQLRKRANQSREAWLSAMRCFVFVESTPGSPEKLDELRDFRAVFRDIFDLRPDVGEDDHLWDTEAAAPLQKFGQRIPTRTKGATLIINGRVRRKSRRDRSCPQCGGELKPDTISIRFELAPSETAVQQVSGYRCACGEEWPEPSEMRVAHARAFGIDPTK